MMLRSSAICTIAHSGYRYVQEKCVELPMSAFSACTERVTMAFRYSALCSARLLSTPTCSTQRYASVRYESSTGGSGRLSDSDRKAMIERIIRVDHAGELGADRIYAGQLAVLSKTPIASVIKHMWDQEKEHLSTMERLVAKHRVAPTVLSPLWNVVGFALGAGSALLGKEGAMACTVAVEETIGNHYNSQIRELMEDDPEQHKELLKTLSRLRDDELEHHDTGLEHDALKAPFYSALKFAIQTGCKGAIWISERV